MEGESSEIQGWCNRYEDIHADPKHIDDFESILNDVDLADIRVAFPIPSQCTFERYWTGGAPLWFQVISLKPLEEFGIATLPHPRMDQMMERHRAMYESTGSKFLEETEAHRRHQKSNSSNNNLKNLPQVQVGLLNKQDQPLETLERYHLKSHIDDLVRNEEEFQRRKNAPTPTLIVYDDEEDADMTVPINSHLKRMKSIGHGPMGAKRRKMNTLTPKETSAQKDLLKMIPTIDGAAGSTAAGLSLDIIQEEAVQKEETIQAKSAETSFVLPTNVENQPPELIKETTQIEDKEKAPMKAALVPNLVAQTSTTTPTQTGFCKPNSRCKDCCILCMSGRGSVSKRSRNPLGYRSSESEGSYDGESYRAEDMQQKEKEWMMLEERFKEMEKKRDKREKEYQQRVAELREATTWGQKPHRENGELLKQVDSHRTTISALSVEVEKEKRKREKAEEKTKNIKRWEERVREEEKQKRKTLHDEIVTLKRNQEMDRSVRQQLQDDIFYLKRDLQGKIDAESRAV
ncbi:hypothetical protein Dimus_033284 [Dionaea muscipula]